MRGAMVLSALFVTVGNAAAFDAATPDWPCVQRKVAELTAAQVWDGPSLEDVKDWYNDKDIAVLARKLANRRITLDDNKAAIKAYAEGLPAAERDKKLTTLFVGTLSVVNDDRRVVMSGIERFQKSQVARSKKLEEESKTFGPAQTGEEAVLDTLTTGNMSPEVERYNLDARVFQERQNSIPLACEIPTLIEERFFEITRAIRANMSDTKADTSAAVAPADAKPSAQPEKK